MSWTGINVFVRGVFRNSPKMNEIVWRSTVGSHMWGMNHAGSDFDIFEVIIQNTHEVLAGRQIRGGKEEKSDNPPTDKTIYEIGHVVEQLQKGNINFLWGLVSPVSVYTEWGKGFQSELKKIVLDNLPKNFIHSITGLVRQNLAKYYGISVKVSDEEVETMIPNNEIWNNFGKKKEVTNG